MPAGGGWTEEEKLRFAVQLLFHRDPSTTLSGFNFEGRTPKACSHTLNHLKAQYVTNYVAKAASEGDDDNSDGPGTPAPKAKAAKSATSSPKKATTPKKTDGAGVAKDESPKKRKGAGDANGTPGKKGKKGEKVNDHEAAENIVSAEVKDKVNGNAMDEQDDSGQPEDPSES